MRRLSFFALFALLGLNLFSPAAQRPAQAQGSAIDLCINDFEDRNQNGQFDAGESSFPGIGVYVRRSENSEIIGSLTTTPDSDCLRSLQPGSYEVAFVGGVPHQATTPATLTITVESQSVTVEFGAIAPVQDSGQLLQAPGNAICVVVYNDVNSNVVRESDEVLIGGIDVNLTLQDVIIETFMTDSSTYRCFTDLPPGDYRVVIPVTPRYQLTTRNDFAPTFIDTGNRVDADFGAVALDPFTDDAQLQSFGASEDKFSLDQDMRLLLAIFGMVLAMLFMVGCGAIILGLRRR